MLISYFFPPLSGPGVQRAYNFSRHLSAFNWDVSVLTVKDIEYVGRDEELLNDLDAADIHRTGSFDPMRLLFLWQNRKGRKSSRDYYKKTGSKIRKLLRDIFPIDSRILWLPFAIHVGKRLLRIKHYDVIMATMSPYSSGILAWILSKYSGVPYILDYRDLWQGKPDISYLSRFHKAIAEYWERKIVKDSAAVIQVTPGSQKRFRELFPEFPSQKVKLIYNGYDEKLFNAEYLPVKSGKIRFLYAGHFYGGQTPQYFLRSVKDLGEEIGEDTVFEFVGNYSEEVEKYFVNARKVVRLSYLTYNEYVKKLTDCEVLILFIANAKSEMIIPQKLFDYLAARRPILALVPEKGDTAKIIRDNRVGIIVNGTDIPAIKKAIISIIDLHRQGNIHKHFNLQNNDISRYSRFKETEELASLLQEVRNA